MVKKRAKKKEIDKQILEEIFKLKRDWAELKSIMDRSRDASERGIHDLSVLQAKYLYLLREARHRKISVMK